MAAGSETLFLFSELSPHEHAHSGRHHQAARPAGRVAQAVQTADVRVEIGVHLDTVAVEFQLRRIQQRLIRREAGHNLVHRLDEIDDVDHRAVRHGGGNVARHGVRQCGTDVGLAQFLLPRALAVENVAEALHHDVSRAEHIRQLAHLLRVGDRLVERHGEIVRAEDGHIRVFRLQLLVRMAVDDREIVVVILLRDEAAGVLTERAHLVFERLRVADELGLIQDAVDRLHDLVAHFHAHADVHRAGLVLHTVLQADFFQPVRAAAPGSDHGVLGVDLIGLLAVLHHDAQTHAVVHDQVAALAAEHHLHAVVKEIILDGVIDIVRLLRAEVADRAVHKPQAGANGAGSDPFDFLGIAQAFDVLVRAEFQINAVGVVDRLLCAFFADERRQVAADLAGQGQLPVRERTCARKAGGNVAIGLAVHAFAGLRLRAPAVFNGKAFFDHQDLLRAAPADHFQRSENAGRPGANDDNVCIHEKRLLCLCNALDQNAEPNIQISWKKRLACASRFSLERATRFELATSTLARWRSAK